MTQPLGTAASTWPAAASAASCRAAAAPPSPPASARAAPARASSTSNLISMQRFWQSAAGRTPVSATPVSSASNPMATTPCPVEPRGPTRSGASWWAVSAANPRMAAMAPVLTTNSTTQANRKAGKPPKASRRNTNQPPARGYAAPSSAKTSAAHRASAPPKAHRPSTVPASPARSATLLGVKKMPMPMMPPITNNVASRAVSLRSGGLRGADGAAERSPGGSAAFPARRWGLS